jgi:Vps16, N-terminal region
MTQQRQRQEATQSIDNEQRELTLSTPSATMADYSDSRGPPNNSSSSTVSTSHRDLSCAATTSVVGGLASNTTSAISSCGILICPLPPSPPISPFRRRVVTAVPQLDDNSIPLFQQIMNPFDDSHEGGLLGASASPSSASSPSRGAAAAAAAAALAIATVPSTSVSSKNSMTSSTSTPPRVGGSGDSAAGRTSSINPFDDGSTTRKEEDSSSSSVQHATSIAHVTTSASSNLMNPFVEEDEEENVGDEDDLDSTDGLANQEVILEDENINRFRRIRMDQQSTSHPNSRGAPPAIRVDESSSSMMTPRHSPLAGPTAEASWQYLGDLPYRRIPVYDNVQWYNSTSNEQQQDKNIANSSSTTTTTTGLACFPTSLFQKKDNQQFLMLDRREMRQLLQTSTITKVAGCPHGGPIAVVTLPVAVDNNNNFSTTEIRILSNSGKCLSKIDFPNAAANEAPYKLLFGGLTSGGGTGGDSSSSSGGGGASSSTAATATASLTTILRGGYYKPSDILTIGFTSRAILIVLLRDSLCLTYTLRGEALLPPFYVLPSSIIRGNTSQQQASASSGAAAGAASSSPSSFKTDKRAELIRAHVYEGGVACLSENKHVAIAEILYGVEDADYIATADLTARIIRQSISSSNSPGGSSGTVGNSKDEPFALVTLLPTAEYAATHFVSFRTLAVLPRHCTSSRHPEVFVSTQDRSVIVVQVANASMGLSSETIVDVACQKRITSPIVDMRFAPNGRFLACFTQDSMLTVISTSFETKVLDFDTSEGSSAPPLDMQWCGEDSVVLHWKNMGVLMVGPYGDWLRFVYEGSQQVHLLPEMDSCRVITDSSVELLQRVPPNTALLLRIGSIETSAMLLDAADAFTAGSPASDEAARSILQTGQLHLAIEACVDAALKEFDIGTSNEAKPHLKKNSLSLS